MASQRFADVKTVKNVTSLQRVRIRRLLEVGAWGFSGAWCLELRGRLHQNGSVQNQAFEVAIEATPL
jgi:hypothetical protein